MDEIANNSTRLESLMLADNEKMIVNFRNPQKLKNLVKLKELDISNIGLSDAKLLSLCKGLSALESLTIEGCQQLTIDGISELLVSRPIGLKRIQLHRTAVERDAFKSLKQLEAAHPDVELVYHKDQVY